MEELNAKLDFVYLGHRDGYAGIVLTGVVNYAGSARQCFSVKPSEENLQMLFKLTEKSEWEMIKGSLVRIKRSERYGIESVGHIYNDDWLIVKR